MCISDLLHTCYMSCPSQSSWFKVPNYVMRGIHCRYSAICNFLHSPVISSLLARNIFLNTLFSNSLNLCSSLKVSDLISQPTIQTVVRPGFTTIQYSLQWNSFTWINFKFLGKQTGRLNFLKWIITCFSHVYSAFNFFANIVCRFRILLISVHNIYDTYQFFN